MPTPTARFVSAMEATLGQVPGFGHFDTLFPKLGAMAVAPEALDELGFALQDHLAAAGTHPSLPAGYTYFGQFVDHDLTLEPSKLETATIDIGELTNFRSPAFDLDCLYGQGPEVTPYLYVPGRGDAAGTLRLGQTRGTMGEPGFGPFDVFRLSDGTPVLGDPRNDENLLVAQTQVAWIKFHNTVLEKLRRGEIEDVGPTGGALWEKARRLVTWHYQWVLLHDFLPRILDPAVLQEVITYGPQHYPAGGDGMMPTEFAAAAYRFGHSLVRETYAHNRIFNPASLRQLFDFSSSGGNVPVPANWVLDWRNLLELPGGVVPNRTRKFDPYAAVTLHSLPGVQPIPGLPHSNSLVVRNLVRGWMWGLPSGQDVANLLGAPVLTPAEILQGGTGTDAPEAEIVRRHGFETQSPLWYYVMKEAEVRTGGTRLGAVGSRIVAETFVGLLRGDANSWVVAAPTFTPTLPRQVAETFTLADVILLNPENINPVG